MNRSPSPPPSPPSLTPPPDPPTSCRHHPRPQQTTGPDPQHPAPYTMSINTPDQHTPTARSGHARQPRPDRRPPSHPSLNPRPHRTSTSADVTPSPRPPAGGGPPAKSPPPRTRVPAGGSNLPPLTSSAVFTPKSRFPWGAAGLPPRTALNDVPGASSGAAPGWVWWRWGAPPAFDPRGLSRHRWGWSAADQEATIAPRPATKSPSARRPGASRAESMLTKRASPGG